MDPIRQSITVAARDKYGDWDHLLGRFAAAPGQVG
jgi:hypothetical protein